MNSFVWIEPLFICQVVIACFYYGKKNPVENLRSSNIIMLKVGSCVWTLSTEFLTVFIQHF